MKKGIFFLFILVITISGFGQINKVSIIQRTNLLNQPDAERILGQSARLTDSSIENTDNAVTYRCTYSANDKEKNTGKTGRLYFMYELYNSEPNAKAVYANIIVQNNNMPNFIRTNNLGDESLRHTDHENFDMIILRKGNKIVRLKVNKLTSMTSVNDLQLVAKRISLNL